MAAGLPIPCSNTLDGEAHPGGFEYCEQLPEPLLDTDVGPATGCSCPPGGCTAAVGRCACTCRTPPGQGCDAQGRLLALLPGGPGVCGPIWECGPRCACGADGACGASTSRGAGALRALRLEKRPAKGWCVLAAAPIPAGAFICAYSGEYVSREEAARRLAEYDAAGRGHALLVAREVLPSGAASLRTNIDATRRGGVARFFNHSCDGGNLEWATVRHAGGLVPRVALFAKRAIPEGEELTFSYGPPSAGPGGTPCRCGTAACGGFMPHEEV